MSRLAMDEKLEETLDSSVVESRSNDKNLGVWPFREKELRRSMVGEGGGEGTLPSWLMLGSLV